MLILGTGYLAPAIWSPKSGNQALMLLGRHLNMRSFVELKLKNNSLSLKSVTENELLGGGGAGEEKGA